MLCRFLMLSQKSPDGHASIPAWLVVRANYEKYALRISQIAATVAKWACKHPRLARCPRKSKRDCPFELRSAAPLIFLYLF